MASLPLITNNKRHLNLLTSGHIQFRQRARCKTTLTLVNVSLLPAKASLKALCDRATVDHWWSVVVQVCRVNLWKITSFAPYQLISGALPLSRCMDCSAPTASDYRSLGCFFKSQSFSRKEISGALLTVLIVNLRYLILIYCFGPNQ